MWMPEFGDQGACPISRDSFLKAIQNKLSPSKKHLQISGKRIPQIWNHLGGEGKELGRTEPTYLVFAPGLTHEQSSPGCQSRCFSLFRAMAGPLEVPTCWIWTVGRLSEVRKPRGRRFPRDMGLSIEKDAGSYP